MKAAVHKLSVLFFLVSVQGGLGSSILAHFLSFRYTSSAPMSDIFFNLILHLVYLISVQVRTLIFVLAYRIAASSRKDKIYFLDFVNFL